MKRWITSGGLALILSVALGVSAAQAGHPGYRAYGGCRPLPPPPACRPSHHHHHHHHHAQAYGYYGGRAAYYAPAPRIIVPYGGGGYPRGTTFGFYFGF